MIEETLPQHNPAQHQHVWRTRFHAKAQRLRRLVFTKWWIPLCAVALGMGVEVVAWKFAKPIFLSVGEMIVSMRLSLPEGSVYVEELSNFLGTQSTLMKSRVVINRAHARALAQMTNGVIQLVSLTVGVVPKTTIFVLQARGEDPQYTQVFLQACMEEYMNLKREMRTQTSDTTLAGLTEGALQLQKELQKSDEDLLSFQSSNSVLLLEQQGNSAGNYVVALNWRLAGLKSEHELLQMLTLDHPLQRQQSATPLPSADQLPGFSRTMDANSRLSSPGASSGMSDSFGASSWQRGGLDPAEADYFRAKQQIVLFKAEQQEMAAYLRPKHPKMVAVAEDISRRERLLDIFRQQSAEQLESTKKSMALQIQNLEREVKEWDAQSLEISRKTAEYQRLKENSQRIQALYDRSLATMQTLDVNKEINPESVNIMEKASTATDDSTTLPVRLLVGTAAGLALSLLLLAFLDRLDDRMGSFTELQDLFDEQVLAQIPRERAAGGKNGVPFITPDDQRHGFVEAYRNLRSSLLYMPEGGTLPKTLLITSSVPSEGKSLTATNLAIILASAGSRVLLVDCDLRKGSLHSQFNLPSEPGMTEILSQALNPREAVRATPITNLWVVPRGAPTQHSSELFISGATEKFFREAAAEYDFLVVDTAPVMAADDVTSLAPHVAATLFIVRADQTSARVAHAALELLYQRRVNLLGLIFNAVRPSTSDYYYYKYHGYHSSPPAAG